ncbi:MAG: ribonuclease Y [Coriobacteriales bacterium]|jgi:ribonuclease Y|nr:ribonuclease Y [Coriobacteriales bacterium]
MLIDVVIAIVALIVGALVGVLIGRGIVKGQFAAQGKNLDSMKREAEKEAESIRKEAKLEAKDAAYQIKQDAEREAGERTKELRQTEQRLNNREENLEKRQSSLDQKENQLERQESELADARQMVADERQGVQEKLTQVAGMSTDEAKATLLDMVKDETDHESAVIIKAAEEKTRFEADKKAREIIGVAIQRVASDHTAEVTVTTVPIPSDDLKGRIIGREGRNIRTFEKITGITLTVDDTPDAITISAFDPVRREIGRITLENLVADGRIQPARIEEMYKKATKLVNRQVQEAGEQAVFDVGISDIHPELIKTLGRLRFRTSYGQNVLNHSLEVAYLSGVLASELGLDPQIAKRAGLLHDLGKAVDHEVDGSHAVIGAELARKYGESEAVVHAIEAHHEDVAPTTVLAVVVQAADAISAARPGARRESMDSYVKRLKDLEDIANGYDGVKKTYAIQAGREVRVMVEPDKVSDDHATVLAHDIAKQIEAEMQYPGQVHVVVVRETRAEDVAK